MIVSVVVTGVVLFPFLLYVVFAHESLIPSSIKMYSLLAGVDTRGPVNPNIPYARRQVEGGQAVLHLEEIMNPFLDKKVQLLVLSSWPPPSSPFSPSTLQLPTATTMLPIGSPCLRRVSWCAGTLLLGGFIEKRRTRQQPIVGG